MYVNQYSGKDNMLGYVSEREFKLQFEDSFKQFFKPLCFHAMSFVKDADIAKDIVHDVFLTTWTDRKSTRLNSSHNRESRMPSSA